MNINQPTYSETKEYKELKRAYANKIKSMIEENECLRPYLVTIRPKFIEVNSLSLDTTQKEYRFFTDATWKEYSRLYRHLISNLTNNYHKKRHLYPLTFDFFDVDKTKSNGSAIFSSNTIPHIHSIYLVHQDTEDRFKMLMNDNFQSIINHPSIKPNFKTMKAEPITHDLEKTVSYASKFYDNSYAKKIRHSYPLFNQFPPLENELISKLSKEEIEDLKNQHKKKSNIDLNINQ